MFGLENLKHKKKLKQAFSDCFDPLKSLYDNVPLEMQTSRYITASILGYCRGYADGCSIKEKAFDVIVDAVFEEIFRQDSLTVQTQTEKWLHAPDEEFMKAYYHAKDKASPELDLKWLRDYSLEHFDAAHEVYHNT
ncbi:MAG: hypothetical protein AB8D52_05300 [Gammaproteobacteria bacterium]